MSSEGSVYDDSCSPLLLQPHSGIHPLNCDPLLLPESSSCLTSIAQGFSTWVSLWGSSCQPHPPICKIIVPNLFVWSLTQNLCDVDGPSGN